MNKYKLCLVGNPNIGKNKIFKSLIKQKFHFNNHCKKTINFSKGKYIYENSTYEVINTPDVYSLYGQLNKELITHNYICFNNNDLIIVVVDSTCLEKSLNILMQVLEVTTNVVVCASLYDKAIKNGILINRLGLMKSFNLPFVLMSNKDKNTIVKLKEIIHNLLHGTLVLTSQNIDYKEIKEPKNRECITLEQNSFIKEVVNNYVFYEGISKVNRTKKYISKYYTISIMIVLIVLFIIYMLGC